MEDTQDSDKEREKGEGEEEELVVVVKNKQAVMDEEKTGRFVASEIPNGTT